jgi:type VI secretion system secreted protein Hcp
MARDIVTLKVEGSKAGAVKGESYADRHQGEIDVHSFAWELRSPTDVVSHMATGRVRYGDLIVYKHIDAASTALMTMLATNEVIRKAVLSARRQGVDNDDYLTITIAKGRVTGYELHQADDAEGRLVERITMTYESVEVAYVGQDLSGARSGATSFMGVTSSGP